MFLSIPLAAVAAALAVGVLAGNPSTPSNHMGSNHMGPAAFFWPNDRAWSAAADNTAPCGSVDSVGNRTKFPMTGGKISLVDQKEASGVELSISVKDNPDSDHDFTTLIKANQLAQLEKGHKCVPVQDAPSSVKPGANATLQIKYTASFDKPENETFYACADITYVELPNFKENIFCHDIGTDTGSETKTGSASIVNSALDSSKKGSSGGSGGLSGGAIAGVVVGVVAAVSMLAAGLIIYRRKQQRLRILRQQNSPRNVKWDERPRDSNSTKSVRLQNLS